MKCLPLQVWPPFRTPISLFSSTTTGTTVCGLNGTDPLKNRYISLVRATRWLGIVCLFSFGTGRKGLSCIIEHKRFLGLRIPITQYC